MEKNVYAFKGLCIIQQRNFQSEKTRLYTLFSCCYEAFFFSSLTQRCLIVIHLCAAILWNVGYVTVFYFCFSVVCVLEGTSQFGAGLEVLVYWSIWLACFTPYVVSLYSIILLLLLCSCTSGLIWTDRARAQTRITSSNRHTHIVFTLNSSDGFHFFFCLDERKDGASSL